ncbi:complex I 24 kDa subunit family protein [Chloroflexota bacterium]
MDDAKIDEIIGEYQGKASSLIQVLLDIQKESRWLSIEVLEKVSEKLAVPFSKVLHEATFYKSLNVIPEGLHQVHVCNGTSCHARGSSGVIEAVQDHTGINPGETDPEYKFSLKAVTCMGCCSSGPTMEVDGQHHGSMDPAKAKDVLNNCD